MSDTSRQDTDNLTSLDWDMADRNDSERRDPARLIPPWVGLAVVTVLLGVWTTLVHL